MFIRCVFVFVLVAPSVLGQIDANLVKTVFELDDSDWNTLQTCENPVDMPENWLFGIADRLRQRHIDGIFRENRNFVINGPDLNTIQSIPQQKFVDISQSLFVTKVGKFNSNLYLCEISIDEKAKCFCFVPKVPKDWPLDKPMKERVGFFGITVRSGTEPVFVASKIAWFPDNLLGKHGMDYGTMDAVAALPIADILKNKRNSEERSMQSLRFSESDVEPFYQMLKAASTIPKKEIDAELEKKEDNNFSVVELFNRPNLQQGKLFRLNGVARRVDKVVVKDKYVREYFGIDHYYQIALFTNDSQGNPLIFCIRELPAGLPIGDGPDFNISLSISGFFYKTWAYKKAGTTQESKSQYQFAPLLIAGYVDWFKDARRASSVNNSGYVWTSTTVFLGLACVWVIFRRFIMKSKPIRFELPSRKIEINEFPVERKEKADNEISIDVE